MGRIRAWASFTMILSMAGVLPISARASASGSGLFDRFGRPLAGLGVSLVDWDGYIANPAVKAVLAPPAGMAFPLRADLTANGPRIYFELPSTTAPDGPRKTMTFENASQTKEFRLSIFPDRDGADEDYVLTIRWTDAAGVVKIETLPIHVIDQDQGVSYAFKMPVVTSFDKSGFFNDEAKTKIIVQAAQDWAYFLADMNFDIVMRGQEQTWIWNPDGFKSGYAFTNTLSFQGFLLYVYGIHSELLRSGGEPSTAGGFQTRSGRPYPLKRSGGVAIETAGNYNTLGWYLMTGDDDWAATRLLSGEVPDLYSIARHEMGHALGFSSTIPLFGFYKRVGRVIDPEVKAYAKAYPRIDISDHFSGAVDPESLKGAFGNEYHGSLGTGMPLGRWIITKLDLMLLKSIGYKLRPTSAFQSLAIKDLGLAEGKAGMSYSSSLAAKGGQPPYCWTMDSGSLPDGLSLDSFTGTVSGTPRARGTYAFTVRLCDQNEANPGIVLRRALIIR